MTIMFKTPEEDEKCGQTYPWHLPNWLSSITSYSHKLIPDGILLSL